MQGGREATATGFGAPCARKAMCVVGNSYEAMSSGGGVSDRGALVEEVFGVLTWRRRPRGSLLLYFANNKSL